VRFVTSLGLARSGFGGIRRAMAGDCDHAFYVEKQHARRHFFEVEFPLVEPWLAVVASHTDVSAQAPVEIF
jgi:hypothetical protein